MRYMGYKKYGTVPAGTRTCVFIQGSEAQNAPIPWIYVVSSREKFLMHGEHDPSDLVF